MGDSIHQHQSGKLMTNNEESGLYKTVRPAFYLIRLFGMAPFSLPKGVEPIEQESPKVLYAYSLIPLCVYTYVVGYIIFLYESPDDYSVTLGIDRGSQWSKFFITCYAMLFSKISLLPMIVNYLILLVEILQSIIFYKVTKSVWMSILDFDQSFPMNTMIQGVKYTDGYAFLIHEFKIYLWTTAIVSIICWSFLSGASIIFNHDDPLNQLCYVLPYYGIYIAVFKFCGLGLLVGKRFEYLNETVLALTTKENLQYNDLRRIKEQEYHKLLNTSEALNRAFSWSLVLHLFNKFFHTVNNMYGLLLTVVNFKFDNFGKTVCVMLWVLMAMIELWALHSVCEYTSRQANRFPSLVTSWYRTAHAKGLCVIDLAATYLVILLQTSGVPTNETHS